VPCSAFFRVFALLTWAHRYGGPAPRESGSIVVSLHRMNRILEVNEKFAYVLVEPGVTFFQLHDYLRSRNIPLWMSAPALGWGSVVGNVSDMLHFIRVKMLLTQRLLNRLSTVAMVIPSLEIASTAFEAWRLYFHRATSCAPDNGQ